MPNEQEVDAALKLIAKGYAQYQYFFERNDDSAWIRPLASQGRFKEPPSAKKEGEYLLIPAWPESRYLARMALKPEAQDDVLKTALEIPPTDNARIHDDMMDIALALPPAKSAQLVAKKAKEWIHSTSQLRLPDRIGQLVVHLAEGREAEAALMVSETALSVRADPTVNAEEDNLWHWRRPVTRFQDFYYEAMVRTIARPLAIASGLSAVEMFCDLLNDFVALSRADTDTEDYDFLAHRITAVEAAGGNDGIDGALVFGLREAAEECVKNDPTTLEGVLVILRKKSWPIFRRVELHLLRTFQNEGREFILEVFKNPEVLVPMRHEAVLLLKESFQHLPAASQSRILQWIDNGRPDEELVRRLEFFGNEVTAKNIRELNDIWRRDWFSLLSGQLPSAYQSQCDALIAALGAGRKLDEPDRIVGGAFAPQSPKTSDDFGSMTVPDVLSFLASWKPGTEVLGSTAEGLGRILFKAIEDRPGEFAREASKFTDLDPTYVRSLFNGLTNAIKSGGSFPWEPVLELASWVCNQSRGIKGRAGGLFVTDPDWGWTRDSIIDLLTAGFEDKGQNDQIERVGRLTAQDRAGVWRALELLLEDPFPTLDDEAKDGFDPISLSINSTRGRAFFALIKYAWWLHACEPTDPFTFDVMPEVRKALNDHLDPQREQSLTIRSVYGSSIVNLAKLDLKWLQDNLARILPLDPSELKQFIAAWDSFVAFNHPNTILLPSLKSAYELAVNQLSGISRTRHAISPEDRLSEHLMIYYWLGSIDLASNSLIAAFYRNATVEVKAHALWFIGNSVPGWGEDAPAEAYERLQRLIEFRLEAAQSDADGAQKELPSFGFWFTSGKFPTKWTIETLYQVLTISQKVHPEMAVVKRLSELSRDYPFECVSCLRLMIEGDNERWLLLGVAADALQLIAVAEKSSNSKGAEAARALRQNLVGRGHYEFRPLLN